MWLAIAISSSIGHPEELVSSEFGSDALPVLLYAAAQWALIVSVVVITTRVTRITPLQREQLWTCFATRGARFLPTPGIPEIRRSTAAHASLALWLSTTVWGVITSVSIASIGLMSIAQYVS